MGKTFIICRMGLKTLAIGVVVGLLAGCGGKKSESSQPDAEPAYSYPAPAATYPIDSVPAESRVGVIETSGNADAYDDGYDDGYEDGYEDGRSGNGYGDSFDDSATGYSRADARRYSRGYEEGYEDGFAEGEDDYDTYGEEY